MIGRGAPRFGKAKSDVIAAVGMMGLVRVPIPWIVKAQSGHVPVPIVLVTGISPDISHRRKKLAKEVLST